MLPSKKQRNKLLKEAQDKRLAQEKAYREELKAKKEAEKQKRQNTIYNLKINIEDIIVREMGESCVGYTKHYLSSTPPISEVIEAVELLKNENPEYTFEIKKEEKWVDDYNNGGQVDGDHLEVSYYLYVTWS